MKVNNIIDFEVLKHRKIATKIYEERLGTCYLSHKDTRKCDRAAAVSSWFRFLTSLEKENPPSR